MSVQGKEPDFPNGLAEDWQRPAEEGLVLPQAHQRRGKSDRLVLWLRARWGRGRMLVVLLLLLTHVCVPARPSVEITGEFNALQFDPQTSTFRELYIADLKVIIHDSAWKIAATNRVDRTKWSVLMHDGTNLFSCDPASLVQWRNFPVRNELVLASVSPGPRFINLVQSAVQMAFPWMVYGLDPSKLGTPRDGVVELNLPQPWNMPRRHLHGYGYKWVIVTDATGRFMQTCTIVRDPSLDAPDLAAELLRPELDYPFTLADLRAQKTGLAVRKEVQDGFIAAKYSVTGWRDIEGWRVPSSAQLERFIRQNDGSSRPTFTSRLQTRTVRVIADRLELLPLPTATTLVQDYRFRKTNETRIFRFAEYELAPGELWPTAADPVLRKQGEDYLKRGPKYGAFGWAGWWSELPRNTKRALVLLGVVLLQVPLALLAWNILGKSKGKTKNHE